MIDSYIILNRKINPIIKIFLLNICIIIVLLIWGINTLNYKSFFHIHSKVTNFNSYYVLEVLIPKKEVNQIIKQNELFIGDKKYKYITYKIDNDIIYKDNINYQKLYLKVNNLDKDYLFNNYRLDIKILRDNKKIIKYFIE